ncbi:MAG: carboxypeptidase-like regulatory domain-containing protein [bacterium]
MNTRGRWQILLLIAGGLVTGCGGGHNTATPTIPTPPVGGSDPGDPPTIPVPDPPTPDPDPLPDPPATRLVTGQVLTPQGLPLAAVNISTSTGASSLSDAEGRFSFADLPQTTVVLDLTASGYLPGNYVVPAGAGSSSFVVALQPLPVDAFTDLVIEAESGFAGTALDIAVPAPQLPYEYFIYRREDGQNFDWSNPINVEPLRQVVIDPDGHAASADFGDRLAYIDRDSLQGGATYSYTVRLRDLVGTFGPAQPEVTVHAVGFGPATTIDGVDAEVLLDTATGADGSLVALYRDMSYQPWHRFIGKRFDGAGNVSEIFRTEGVFDDARVFVDRYDQPCFMYRRNGIEFLFETYLIDFWEQTELGPDIRLGQSNRRIDGELGGELHFRPDPEGQSPEENLAVFVNRDRNLVAERWDYGQGIPNNELVIDDLTSTNMPRLVTIENPAGDLAVLYNKDFVDTSYYWIGFVHGAEIVPGKYFGDGSHMSVAGGATADGQFAVAFTTAADTGVLQLQRYQPDGAATGNTGIDLTLLGRTLTGGPGRINIVALPNGKTVLTARLEIPGNGYELHAWDITDYSAIRDLGAISLSGAVPESLNARVDRAGKIHVVSEENGHTIYRQLFWPGAA